MEPGNLVCLFLRAMTEFDIRRKRQVGRHRDGEEITETLEVIPKSWKVIRHVREKFTCRDCEKISQAPAPFHVIARGWAGPNLEKFGQHQPLNRQAERYAKEGVPISLSTLADQVGGCTAALMPLFKRLEACVLGAERWHGDDTAVPVLAKGKTDTGRNLGLCARRQAFWRAGAARGGVLLLARSRASIPRLTWPTTPGSSRLTLMKAMASFASQAACPVRSRKPPVGSMPGVRSS